MRALVVVLSVIGAVALGVLGFAYLLSDGGLFSRPYEDWTVDVEAGDDRAWDLLVPALIALDDGKRASALDELYRDLHVRQGNATLARTDDGLRVHGSGDVTIVAHRSGQPSAFGGWGATELNVTRLDTDGPGTTVAWSIDFSGGKGATCMARDTWTVAIAAGEKKDLIGTGHLNLPGRPWNTACV